MAEHKTFGAMFEEAGQCLKESGITDARSDLIFLLQAASGMSYADYLLKMKESVPDEIYNVFMNMIRRRSLREPSQYIAGDTEFMGLSFLVTPDVLIPRQDTEILAEAAIQRIRQLIEEKRCHILPDHTDAAGEKHADEKFHVLDLCTGSGALAVSIRHYCPETEVSAVDISKEALVVAKQNAAKNAADVTFLQSDMFQALDGCRYDMIVSNPPYVTEEEYRSLMPEVRCFEPKQALTAGEDGLDFYRIIAEEAGKHLYDHGFLLLEIGCEQAGSVSCLLQQNGFQNVEVLKDLSGLDRVVIGIKYGKTN